MLDCTLQTERGRGRGPCVVVESDSPGTETEVIPSEAAREQCHFFIFISTGRSLSGLIDALGHRGSGPVATYRTVSSESRFSALQGRRRRGKTQRLNHGPACSC